MNQRTPEQWEVILKTVGASTKWKSIFSVYFQGNLFSAGDAELPAFLSQIIHESANLTALEENLNYSAEGLMKTWPKRFPTLAYAKQFERKSALIAEKVYGGRYGNTEPGDGWKYRGSGLIQITFKDNFKLIEKETGYPVVDNPDLLRQPGGMALEVARIWWEKKIPDSIISNPTLVRKTVNGGTIGLEHTTKLYAKLKELL